eukprot:2801339-Alexandrium_andersonii.AAC.1
MSASLVGSEMCIRDSRHSNRSGDRSSGNGSSRQRAHDGQDGRGHGSRARGAVRSSAGGAVITGPAGP